LFARLHIRFNCILVVDLGMILMKIDMLLLTDIFFCESKLFS
jgi:hypothetical protein